MNTNAAMGWALAVPPSASFQLMGWSARAGDSTGKTHFGRLPASLSSFHFHPYIKQKCSISVLVSQDIL